MQGLKNTLVSIKGMHCSSCAAKIEKALKNNNQVKEASVNFVSSKANIQGTLSFQEIKKIIVDLGYDVLMQGEETSHEAEVEQKKKELFISAAAGFIVLCLAMLPFLKFPGNEMIQLILTTVILFYPGRRFFINTFKLLKKFSVNMDTLIALGSGAAYGYSVFAVFALEPIYFETASLIITFVLIGNYLEAKAKSKANQAIQELIKMTPQVGRVIRNGEERILPITEIEVGEEVIVKPGDKIPLDGIVLEGLSTVNESTITGESMPVAKEKGDTVLGTTMNGSGALHIKITRKSTETYFAQLIHLVEEAQNSKAPIQKLADTVSLYFVPLICLIALFTFFIWMSEDVALAIKYAVAVLVVACPCALGLATPTAIITSTGTGARCGILIKNAEILQKLGSVNVVLFDKTGTLTEGKPAITQIISFSEIKDLELITIAASGEKKSEHPLSMAFVKHAEDLQTHLKSVQNFKAHGGKGVSFIYENKKVLLGNEALMEEEGISLEKALSKIEDYKKLSNTFVFLSIENDLKGMFLIADKIKEEARLAVQKIKELNIRSMMLTGDNAQTARNIANQLFIEDVVAHMKPHEKLEKIKELQNKNFTVAMVGDGVNDAPALSTANVGIALEGGSHVALESSDITLLSGDILKVSDAISLSRKTLKIIKQNLFWAFFYNVAAIPLAAFGYLHPMIAAGAMSLSSLTVVLNALRLKTKNVV